MRTYANLKQQTTIHTKKAGFTLIELLVVVGITAMVMITVSTIFMTFLLSNARTNARRVIQSDGNTALSQIEFEIRNAKAIVSTCNATPINTLTITDRNGENIIITKDGTDKLTINGKVITAKTVLNTLGFTCTGAQVKVSFSLNITDNFDNSLTQEFETTVQVRNLAL